MTRHQKAQVLAVVALSVLITGPVTAEPRAARPFRMSLQGNANPTPRGDPAS